MTPFSSADDGAAPPPSLVWFRDDLRLADNPALTTAAARGPVCALYVLDEVSPGVRPLGGASRWWLHHSLERLAADLAARGVPLVLRRGAAADIVPTLARTIGAGLVTFNRRYGAAEKRVDAAVTAQLAADGIETRSFAAHVVAEPDAIRNKSGAPFKVFSPFWRALQASEIRRPLGVPRDVVSMTGKVESDRLASWSLLPTTPDWAGGLRATWTPGEAGARDRLERFLDTGLRDYAGGRDRPDRDVTSRLSPHLRFGEISPVMLFDALDRTAAHDTGIAAKNIEKFRSEIAWREFSYHLLGQFPDLGTRNFQSGFDGFPFGGNEAALRAWQRGQTGYPIVDAGMRELWDTGFMHNRVRMVVASFLVKHLLVDWREGEAWFWDTLVDADPANNTASWQWVAGSGADAAPYFRVFNPMLQGVKFDPEGRYVRRWVPELALVPDRFVHAPWEAGGLVLAEAGVRLGDTYPHPIVDHAAARDRALAAYQAMGRAAPADG